MITGMPQQIIGTQHQMIMMQQPSSAPNVIGVFVIIWGGLQILSTIGGAFINDLLPEASQVDTTMEWYDYLFSLLSIAFGLGFIYGGYAITNRQKFGVHLTWILLSVLSLPVHLSSLLLLLSVLVAVPPLAQSLV